MPRALKHSIMISRLPRTFVFTSLELVVAMTAMDKKLRLSSDRCSLLGPDGKVIRYLFASETAGISIADTFSPGYADDHVEEMIYSEEEVERRLAWLERDKKEQEHLSHGGKVPPTNNVW